MPLTRLGDGTDLVRRREPLIYTQAEQQFSVFIQSKMLRLLKGDDNDLLLMRLYCQRRQEVAFFMPSRLKQQQIRPQVAETIIHGVLRFLDPYAPGGPIAQQAQADQLIETQTFPTQYPHIIVERTDLFVRETRQCVYIEWKAVRLQNQRKSTLINRTLDLANLAFELARFIPMG